MRNIIHIIMVIGFSLAVCSCDKSNDNDPEESKRPSEVADSNNPIPEGYFEVVFSMNETRAAISGADGRIQDLRYLLFKSTGEFVKEKQIVTKADGVQTWPLQAIRDTLPKGEYRAVLLGNTEKTLFPYAKPGSPVNYNDVLVGYRVGYSSGKIVIPPAEFSNNTEYYMANVTFSDVSPNPYILLQRIIGAAKLKRVFVDAQTALNSLVNNIVTQINYRNIIQNNVQALLPGLVKTALQGSGVSSIIWATLGGIDVVTNAVVAALVAPVTDALYALFLQKLVEQIGLALVGNTNKADLLDYLARILNPWHDGLAAVAVVSLYDFPKTMDFDLNVIDKFNGLNKFKYGFVTEGNNEKYILIKGFNADYDVRDINVVGTGLISGVIVDQVIDTYLLPGAFVDIKDPINVRGDKRNLRYYSNYAFLSLGLKSYVLQTDGNHSLTLSVKIGNIAGIDNILAGIPLLGTILSLVSGPIKNITVTTSVNLPLLGIDNLTLSGGWNPLPAIQY